MSTISNVFLWACQADAEQCFKILRLNLAEGRLLSS